MPTGVNRYCFRRLKFTARLQPGKNKIAILAHGPGGDSAPAKITILRGGKE